MYATMHNVTYYDLKLDEEFHLVSFSKIFINLIRATVSGNLKIEGLKGEATIVLKDSRANYFLCEVKSCVLDNYINTGTGYYGIKLQHVDSLTMRNMPPLPFLPDHSISTCPWHSLLKSFEIENMPIKGNSILGKWDPSLSPTIKISKDVTGLQSIAEDANGNPVSISGIKLVSGMTMDECQEVKKNFKLEKDREKLDCSTSPKPPKPDPPNPDPPSPEPKPAPRPQPRQGSGTSPPPRMVSRRWQSSGLSLGALPCWRVPWLPSW